MRNKKQLAAKILKVSPKKVIFKEDALGDIKKAITRSDIRGLIAIKKIVKSNENEQSRGRARKIRSQKRKGRRRGRGSKKGASHSIVGRKEAWIQRVRVQREFLKELRDKKLLSLKNFHMLYNKVKGGFFRNKRHIKLYITDYHLIEGKGEIKENN